MPEPLGPAAVGVASLLKSLRTRAGLKEDRLSGTELALDTLTGLDGVRELMVAGDSPEHAIVRAVKAAASSLEPTLSIVADVSLCLELSADALGDSELYAGDLSRRRAALLANWDRLHELRSAPPEVKAPTPRALRLELETTALNALAAALTAATSYERHAEPVLAPAAPGSAAAAPRKQVSALSSAEMQAFGTELSKSLRSRGLSIDAAAGSLSFARTEVERWEAGRDLPSEAQAYALDQYLSAGGAISSLAAELRSKSARSPQGSGAPRLVTAQIPTLLQEFQKISAALRDCLTRDGRGDPQGWPHDLRRLSDSPTPMATAYGIKAMLLLEESLAPDLIPVAGHLRAMELSGGGFAARAQSGSRPEVTATVLDALSRIDATASFDAQIATLERALGEFEKDRPFILASVLETSARLRPDSGLTTSLTSALLAARRPYGDLLLWPEKAEPLLIAPAASPVHTARAVRALAQVEAVRPSARIQEALEQGAGWLAEQANLGNVSEIIERPVDDGGVETLYIRHFTAAWVARALVSVGLPASHPSVSAAVARIWRGYSEAAALWSWNNGDLPIWMTFDAIESLHMTALATTIRIGN